MTTRRIVHGAAAILVAAMAVTPFLNNAATVLVMAPIAAGFATGLGYKPDAFLMAVAIGAGCDFLTPIGHQCNTLVMGPGGYRFGDDARRAAVAAGHRRRRADAAAGLAGQLGAANPSANPLRIGQARSAPRLIH